jgi:hypothetical protein
MLGGTPVFKADMLANGDRPAAIVKAFPQLDADRVRLAAIYALAYPARARPRTKPRRSRLPRHRKRSLSMTSGGREIPGR